MSGAFLDSLTETEAEDLRSIGRERSYAANVTLFHHGDETGPVIVLLDGRVKVVSPTVADREVIVAVRGPGELLGELSAIDGEPRSATVTTLEPVQALLVPGSAFASFLDRRPRVALVILRVVAGRLRYADAQQAGFATHDVVGRVAQRLVEMSERFGASEHGRIEIALPLSQEELAAWTGASREAVSKALQLLRSLGVLETGRRHVTVLDLEALRRHAR
jgi:CRP-like cAMP-binding protein